MRPASGIALLILLCACAPKLDEAGLREFAHSFESASAAANTEPMLTLYHLEGSDARTVSILRIALQSELRLPIERIAFHPLTGAPEETINYTFEGRRYGPTLQPRLRMHVSYATRDALTSRFTIGQRHDGKWRIVGARPLN